MTKVVWLKPGEPVPTEGRTWALVAHDPEGSHVGDAVPHDHGVTFYIPIPASTVDQSEAIARARAWAERNHVEAVYVAVG